MNEIDQNKAIAEACGVKYHRPTIEEIKRGSYYQFEPNYVRDLNAMRCAVSLLPAGMNGMNYARYVDHLQRITRADRERGPRAVMLCTEATAAQRAESFLRTLNLWKE